MITLSPPAHQGRPPGSPKERLADSGFVETMLGCLDKEGFRNELVPVRSVLSRLMQEFADASRRPRAADVMREWSTVSRLGGF